jgi:hypothetical protein
MKIAGSEKKQPKYSSKPIKDNGRRVYPPCRHRVHLKTAEDIRRLLSSVVNDLRQQKIDPVVAGKIIYGSQVLLGVFEQHVLAVKIAELEQMIKDAGYDRR